MSGKNVLLKASLIIMFATLISRIFGLVRMQVINWYFPQALLDPFWSAFKIPNTLRELLGEGALSVAFIPIFTSYLLTKGKEEASKLASNVINILVIVVVIVVALGILLAPVLMPEYVAGFSQDSSLVKLMPKFVSAFSQDTRRVQLAITLAEIMMPFLLFASMGAIVMGILNSHKHFAAPAFAPIFFSLGLIATIVLFHDKWGPASLGWGVLFGGLLQLLFQIPFLRGRGIKWSFRINFKHSGVRDVLRLMGPAALALGVVQINQLLAPVFSSYVKGGMSALQNGILLIQMPQGVFAIAVSTAILPLLSEQVATKDFVGFKNSMSEGIGLVLLFTIPATMFFIFMGRETVDAIFNLGGQFGAEGSRMTAKALGFYAFGLIGMAGTVLANRFFYSMKNMKTPFFVALVSVAVNLIANIIFFNLKLGFETIALANTLAVTVNLIILMLLIQRKVGKFKWLFILNESFKILLASILMIGIIIISHQQLSILFGVGIASRVGAMALSVGAGGLAFIVAGYLLKIKEIKHLSQSLKRKFSR